MNKQKNNQGFSLIEMLVSVAIFTVVITISLSIFQSVNKSQSNAIAVQSVQESMRYVMEVMSKELRSAKHVYSDSDGDGTGDTDDCLNGGVYDNYLVRFSNNEGRKVYNFMNSGGDLTLYFKNKNLDCVYYYIDATDNRLYINRAGTTLPITPDELKISDLQVEIDDNAIGEFHDRQAVVTVHMSVETLDPNNKYKMNLQTSISSRHYE